MDGRMMETQDQAMVGNWWIVGGVIYVGDFSSFSSVI